jgi:adenylate cyclase
MIVGSDGAGLVDWAVGFQRLVADRRPLPRIGMHHGLTLYRDGDYFGSQDNLAHRIVNRALAGEVMVTDAVCEAIAGSDRLELEGIGQVSLKGFPVPTELFVVRAA